MRVLLRGCRVFSACSLALALLAACQSGSAPEALDSAAHESHAAADVSTRVGSGSAHVDLFIDRSMPGTADDYRDGAALAAKKLAAGKLALSVHDLRSGTGDLAGEVRKAAAGGSKFFIGPPSLSGAAAAAASGSAVVLLASEPVAGGGAIISDEVDGLIEVAAYAAGAGRKDIMAVASRHLSDVEAQRLRSGLKGWCQPSRHRHGSEFASRQEEPRQARQRAGGAADRRGCAEGNCTHPSPGRRAAGGRSVPRHGDLAGQ
ncbi:hypothetical protein [Shinella zoogloeoides]|uniref:hypothetical protein n=1 Tax=Shinella zoogloeoides TaxID=352475 RepID=UPI00299E4393|nr:hypothetical protein [Shinella zoogloeoides]